MHAMQFQFKIWFRFDVNARLYIKSYKIYNKGNVQNYN